MNLELYSSFGGEELENNSISINKNLRIKYYFLQKVSLWLNRYRDKLDTVSDTVDVT